MADFSDKQTLTIPECIEAYGKTVSWYRRKLKEGKLLGKRNGGWVIYKSSLEAYFAIAAHKVKKTDFDIEREAIDVLELKVRRLKMESELKLLELGVTDIAEFEHEKASLGLRVEYTTQREGRVAGREEAINEKFKALKKVFSNINEWKKLIEHDLGLLWKFYQAVKGQGFEEPFPKLNTTEEKLPDYLWLQRVFYTPEIPVFPGIGRLEEGLKLGEDLEPKEEE